MLVHLLSPTWNSLQLLKFVFLYYKGLCRSVPWYCYSYLLRSPSLFEHHFIRWLLLYGKVTREKDCLMLPWRPILSASRSMRVKSCRWTWFLDHAAVFSVDSWSAIYSMNPSLNAPLLWSVPQDLAVESNWREKLYGARRKFDNKSPFSSNFLAILETNNRPSTDER